MNLKFHLRKSKARTQGISFPIADGLVDTGLLIRRAENEMQYLQLSYSTSWQYMQAWLELYTFFCLSDCTLFTRGSFNDFIDDTKRKLKEGSLHEWKRKIRIRSVCVLFEAADTGRFEWKQFHS